jgi:hypothetical protein
MFVRFGLCCQTAPWICSHSRRVARMPQQRANAPVSPVKLSFKEKLTGRGLSSDAIQKKLKVRTIHIKPKFFLSLMANALS